jgi:hypothetical protein
LRQVGLVVGEKEGLAGGEGGEEGGVFRGEGLGGVEDEEDEVGVGDGFA